MKTYRVVIIEDDAEFAELQKEIVNQISPFTCDVYYVSAIDFLEEYQEKVDILLLDLILPQLDGIKAIPMILKKYPQVSIIVNSIRDDTDTILEALRQGAVGYIDKQDFVQYIEKVLLSVMDEGAFMTPKIAKKVFNFFQEKKNKLENLTEREMQVAHGIIDGLSYKLVADRLGISLDTVRMNIRNIYKKMKIHSKSELISYVVGNHYKNK